MVLVAIAVVDHTPTSCYRLRMLLVCTRVTVGGHLFILAVGTKNMTDWDAAEVDGDYLNHRLRNMDSLPFEKELSRARQSSLWWGVFLGGAAGATATWFLLTTPLTALPGL